MVERSAELVGTNGDDKLFLADEVEDSEEITRAVALEEHDRPREAAQCADDRPGEAAQCADVIPGEEYAPAKLLQMPDGGMCILVAVNVGAQRACSRESRQETYKVVFLSLLDPVLSSMRVSLCKKITHSVNRRHTRC